MKRTKTLIKVRCEICDSLNFEKVTDMRHSLIGELSMPIAICKTCGHVTVWPRLSDEDYKTVNEIWYPKKFQKDPIDLKDENYKFKKWRKMWERIEPFFLQRKSLRLLDIGAGQGWGTEFLQQKFENIEATAIEQWKPSQEFLKNKLGAEVIDKDIDENWNKFLNKKYDLIIFRHTLEHVKRPVFVLEQIQKSLAKGGLAYIVVPNVENIDKPIRTDYFRPVHLHYFSPDTFISLLSKCGLSPIANGFENEIWGLFESQEKKFIKVSNYLKQKKLINKALRKYKLIDEYNILKIRLKNLFKKIV
ncbi:MAG: class I SAM-dependent methyltransferase [Prochlorococcus marinus CUG1439]|uniref:class I SAM-dependent methyltransferase n=1 Tax=Prochlorococcus sp. MIT 1314 TaxID=3096220 RepID=UPI001B04371F|nr:class I SAM-dependent methyltransferase [Prochlorococcus sp. MIT 1314]MCR8538821.1 class I SAM-dependent methyltransferase [Prochlorococcus marinus CUG1439]